MKNTNIHKSASVDETAKIHPTVVIAEDVVICKNVTIGEDSRIDRNVFICSDVEIGTHVRVSEFTKIEPRCDIGNYTQIGRVCWLGAGTIIEEDVRLGADCQVSINSIIRSHAYFYDSVILTLTGSDIPNIRIPCITDTCWNINFAGTYEGQNMYRIGCNTETYDWFQEHWSDPAYSERGSLSGYQMKHHRLALDYIKNVTELQLSDDNKWLKTEEG